MSTMMGGESETDVSTVTSSSLGTTNGYASTGQTVGSGSQTTVILGSEVVIQGFTDGK